jgi:hypothetical protein
VTDKLYTRVRGQVRGPFAQDKLRVLVKRGQLTRIHEVSVDGTSWQKASEFGELFEADAPKVERQSPAQQSVEADEYSLHEQQQNTPAPAGKTEWYYAQSDQQFGPVDFGNLCDLVADGKVGQNDEVWCHGMQDWIAVKDHPDLAITSHSVAAPKVDVQTSDNREKSSNEIGGQIVRTLADSSGWLTFIAIIGYIYGGLLLVGAFFLMLAGASERVFPIVGMGIGWLVYSGVTITGAVLLNRHVSAIGNFVRAKNQQTLDIVLRRIRTFWVFVAIVLTVILVNTIGVAIWISLFAAQIFSVFN